MSDFIVSDDNLEEVLNEIPKEELNNILSRCLTKKEERIIRMRLGIQEPGKFNPLYDGKHDIKEIGDKLALVTDKVREIEAKALKKISKHLTKLNSNDHNTKAKEENIVEECKEETIQVKAWVVKHKEQIIEKIEQLPALEVKAFYSRFGKNLDENNYVGESDNQIIYRAIKKLKRMINDPNYVPETNTTRVINRKNPITIIKYGKRSRVFLKEKLGCSKDVIYDLAINLIKDADMDILFRYYGSNLTKVANELEMPLEDYEKLELLYPILKEKLNNLEQYSYLKDILGATDEEVKQLTRFFRKESIRYNAFIQTFGSDFSSLITDLSMFKTEKSDKLWAGFHVLRQKLEDTREQQDQTLQEILDCNDEEFAVVMNVRHSSKVYQYFSSIAGENFKGKIDRSSLSKEEKKEFRLRLQFLYSKLANIRKEKKVSLVLDVPDFSSYVKYYFGNYPDHYQKLKDIFGNNLDKAVISYLIKDDIKGIIDEFTAGYSTYQSKHLSNIIVCSNDELVMLKKYLQEHDSNILLKLQEAYGKNLDEVRQTNLDINLYLDDLNNILNTLRSSEEVTAISSEQVPEVVPVMQTEEVKENTNPEILTSKEYDTIESPLKHPFFKELLKVLPLRCQLMASLRLGIYDGNIHSIPEIAEVFEVNENEVSQELNKVKILFSTLASGYKESFGMDFPAVDDESLLELKRHKD